jgi:hypothetical protein
MMKRQMIFNLYLIATVSGVSIVLVKSLGANEVIDYKSQDIAPLIKDVDLVRISK